MKFDKDVITGIIICIVVLFGWEPVARRMGWITPPASPAAAVQQKAAPAPAAPAAAAKAAPEKTAPRPVIADGLVLKPAPKLSPVTLQGRDVAVTIDPNLGAVSAVTLKDYFQALPRLAPADTPKKPLRLDLGSDGKGMLAVLPGADWVTQSVFEFRVSGQRCTLKRQLIRSSGSRIEHLLVAQEWEVPAEGCVITSSLQLLNAGKTPVILENVTVKGGELPPWQQMSGDRIRYDVQRLGYLTTQDDFNDVKGDAKESDFSCRPEVRWAGSGNKYFVLLLRGGAPFTLEPERRALEKKDEYLLSASAGLGRLPLAPGESRSWSFQSYAGPKIAARLAEFAPEAQRMLHLTWGPLDYLARLLLWILVKLNAFVGNYGVSIILLTLIVRLIFYPVTAKANASMRKMQSVGPKLKEIRDQYKNDPQKMNQLTMELYRKEGVNPFGGCLPILLQIPVFFALYATLDGAVQLRQTSFLWAHDLAAPDTVAMIPLYFFDLPVNPLVLAMTLLMVIQQRMTPMSMDPMQKKMMMMMPVVMLFVLYELPSGLTLYWTVSNFFSIIQLKLQQRTNPPPAAPAGKA